MHSLLTLNLPDSLTSRRLADGTTFADAFARLTEDNAGIHKRLLSYKDQWPLGWLDVNRSDDMVFQIQNLTSRFAYFNSDLVVFGIGGSALGAQAINRALNPDTRDLKFVDNIDPASLQDLVIGSHQQPGASHAVNVISKSGTTLETMAAFIYFENDRHERSLSPDLITVATTDEHKGILREWADHEKWSTLPVPSGVGGRFSVLTPVGLFPLAYACIEIAELLDGAASWQTSAIDGDLLHNEAWQLAALHYLLHTQGGANCAVQYIYGDPLLLLGDWFRQLWAESLAKRNRLDGTTGDGGCLTPVVARGTTDQHSQNQLYMEGPDDKVYGFITCAKWPEDPEVLAKESGLQIPAELEYLRGRTFGELLEACRLGTRDALQELGRPVYEIILPELSERCIGAYMQMWMLATAYAGLLYNVNAFDQPGVERSKQLAMQRLLKL